jgi:heavy metal translocating P-type ATPase
LHHDPTIRERLQLLLLPISAGGLALGVGLAVAGRPELAAIAWAVPAVVLALWLAASIVRDLVHREGGVDVIALLAIVGAIVMDELLAAAVIGVMLATGDWLERYAQGRARRELSALVSRAPRSVHRYEDGLLVERSVAEVAVGDRLLVKPGEVVPVDGVARTPAVLDESALTGESRLATRAVSEPVSSGTVNAGSPFDVVATAAAAESTYAGIVRLVEAAQREKTPFVRLADRYALLFVPLTLGIAGAAWAVSGDPTRALAVLVVATPCPLLLATPIAIVAGMSRAARRGIIVKGGGSLEALARARVLLFDKTGTLTAGRPHLADVLAAPGRPITEVLRTAASLEQVSPHVLAASIVAGARERRIEVLLPADARETAGAGIAGVVGGVPAAVGTLEFVATGAAPGWARRARRRASLEGAMTVWVSIDRQLAGVLVLDDPIRPETPRVIRALRRVGVSRIVMVTGDHYGVADLIGAAIGVDAVIAERSPAEKVESVAEERRNALGVLVMVGDGINDAPALATADVGVAMGARGATASSEAADVVITVDRLDRLPEAILLARRSRSIALQSILLGMGLSMVAMAVATTGLLPVLGGAILQEAIDVIAIANALRALTGGEQVTRVIPGWSGVGSALRAEHRELAPSLATIRPLADALGTLPPARARADLLALRAFLVDVLVPHEQREDRDVFPRLGGETGSDDLTAGLHRTHTEIFHLVRLIDRLVGELPPQGPATDDLTDLRRALYGLDAIVRLHMAQEEELYLLFGEAGPVEAGTAAAAA